jgi:hypothetical protein
MVTSAVANGAGGATARLLRAGALTAVVDGLFSSLLSVFAYGSTVTRLFQGVAAVAMGSAALSGGWRTALIGIALHVGVAYVWSAVFVFGLLRSRRLRRVLAGGLGVLKVAALYGPAVWLAMSLVVIPAFTGRPAVIGFRWWVQLVGHAPFVGLPIVAAGAGRLLRSERKASEAAVASGAA